MPSLKYDHKNLLEEIQRIETLDALSKAIPNPIAWLKRVLSLIIDIDKDLLGKYEVLPNQLGNFKKQGDDLFFNDDIVLKEEDNERGALLYCHYLILNSEFEYLLLHVEFEDIDNILPREKQKSEKTLIGLIDKTIEDAKDRRDSKFVKALQLLFKWLDKQEDDELIKEFRYLSKNKPDLYFNTFTDHERDLAFTIAQSGKLSSLSKLAESSLTNEDINSMLAIGNSGVDINKMSELAELSKEVGVEAILTSAKELVEERRELLFKKEIGENVEQILNKVFEREFPNYKARLERTKDYDILINNTLNPSKQYFIELKSIRENNTEPIKMGIHQARKAKANPDNYALLLIRRPPESSITEQYLRNNIICDYQIGTDVISVVDKSQIVDKILSLMDPIKLEIKDPTMKVHIRQKYIEDLDEDFEKLKANIHEAIK